MKIAFYFCSLMFCIMSFTNVQGQNLSGEELSKADQVSSALESGIGRLFGAKNLEGNITKITVNRDNTKSVELKIEYTGFENRWLKAKLLTAQSTMIGSISIEPIQLVAGQNNTELVLMLNATEDNSIIESQYLKLLVCKQKNDITGKVFYYILPKQWKQSELSISDEEKQPTYVQKDLTLTITPVPIGSAAQLNDNNTNFFPVPGRTMKVQLNKDLYKANIERKPMMVKMHTLQVKQPTTQTKKATTIQSAKILRIPTDQNASQKKPDQTMRNVKMVQFNSLLNANLQLSKEDLDKGAGGPGKKAIVLWDEIRADLDFDYGEQQISNISTDIFTDTNEGSGYYYYYPSSYVLVWDPDESYKLNILYGSGTDEESGKVRMFAKLSPHVGTAERQMVENLIKDYAVKNGLAFKKLLPMPLDHEPTFNLANNLRNLYNVEDVSATVSGLFDPIDVAWQMSTKSADDLMVGLKEIDLTGTMQLAPQGETPEINVPVKISLDDENVLGRLELTKYTWRNYTWVNQMPFPVRLKYFHALFLKQEAGKGTQPYIYSWSLNDTEVPVLAKVRFNNTIIPKLVDNKAQKIWIEYTVPNCDICKDNVINSLTGGTTNAREQKIGVTSYVKEDIGALIIEITVRSLYADPKRESIIELPSVRLDSDFETYYISPLYVSEGKTPEYEYKIKIVTDENIYRSEWIYSNELNIDLNKSVLRDALGFYPGEE